MMQKYLYGSNDARYKNDSKTKEDNIFERPYIKDLMNRIKNYKKPTYKDNALVFVKLVKRIKQEQKYWEWSDVADYLNKNRHLLPNGVDRIITQQYIKKLIKKVDYA